ncbi:glycosyl hydrolase family 26-domain-containing protein [Leptodontidium sp. MPI-SDFR-AT-0119]|nr:glycosyl hydrolase family 26-domain-containing protein [Leptodontidium sp. MPI-SDFR-AT-0119]
MRQFSLLALASLASAVVYEAELATFTGGVHVASDVPGYTGTGYVAGFAADGDTVSFAVNGLTAGSYDIAVIYSAQYGDKFTTMAVNGVSSEVAITNVTTSTWATSKAGSFALTASNTITLSNDWGWYFIDSITVSPTPVAPVVVVDVSNGAKAEAENGIFNGVSVGTTTPGFSGTGFVQGFDAATDSVTITLYSSKQALYDVVVGYAAIYGEKQTSMSLNGAGGASIVLADTTTAASPWANATAGQVLLNAGNNTITFTNNWGWYFIDVVYVTPSPAPAPHKVTSSLVVPNILPVAQALFNKLLSKYASGQIFSGQADPGGVSWLEANVGKTPAIIGLDMIDYSPSRVMYGATSTAVEDAIAFDARNGMVAFQWHWNAPSHLINNDTVPWWKGFYSYGSTFNLTAVLAAPTSTDYALLISDMDAIATQLLRLQAANIPVLWRPLHEADGTWFWWGAYGPESCVTLYRLMYDRFTNYHKLRNLIWVWNSVTPSWYPGDDVVDILGYDSYPPLGDHGPVSAQYQQLIALGKDKKLVTLPEVGNIPDPDILKLYRADWSYFVTWNGDFIETETYNPLVFKQKVYNDPTVLKLTDLGNWKGSATSTSTAKPTSTSSSKSSSTLITSTIKSSSSSSSTKSTSTSSAPTAAATQVHWGQCGGTNWAGPTVCEAGTTCVAVSPPWYSQCL